MFHTGGQKVLLRLADGLVRPCTDQLSFTRQHIQCTELRRAGKFQRILHLDAAHGKHGRMFISNQGMHLTAGLLLFQHGSEEPALLHLIPA